MTRPNVDPIPPDPPAPPPPKPGSKPWCLFRCGGAPFAVGVGAVAEVVEVDRLVPLPNSPPRVLGLCTLRRGVVPVVGLGPPAGGPDGGISGRCHVMILRAARGPWGLRIDGEGTAVVEEPLDADVPPGGPPGAVLLGTVRHDEAGFAALEPEATWRDLRRAAESWYAQAT